MPPTISDRMDNILEAIAKIDEIVTGWTAEDFKKNMVFRMACERFLEIICEAARHVPERLKAQATHIEWQKMTSFANHLHHAYHATKVEIVWSVIKDDLPDLKAFAEGHRDAAG